MTESPKTLKLNFRQWQTLLVNDSIALREVFEKHLPSAELVEQIESHLDSMRLMLRPWLANAPAPQTDVEDHDQTAPQFQHDPDIKAAIDAAPKKKKGWPAGKKRGPRKAAGAVQ